MAGREREIEDVGRIKALRALLKLGRLVEALQLTAALVASVERRVAARRAARPVGQQMELPFHLSPATVIENCPLGCKIRAAGCVARQRENERLARQRGHVGPDAPAGGGATRKKRGSVAEYPNCETSRCAIGRAVRAALEGAGHGQG